MIRQGYPGWKKTLGNAGRSGSSVTILTHCGGLQSNIMQRTASEEVWHEALNHNKLLFEKQSLGVMDKASHDGPGGNGQGLPWWSCRNIPTSSKGHIKPLISNSQGSFHTPLLLMNQCWIGTSRSNLKQWHLSTVSMPCKLEVQWHCFETSTGSESSIGTWTWHCACTSKWWLGWFRSVSLNTYCMAYRQNPPMDNAELTVQLNNFLSHMHCIKPMATHTYRNWNLHGKQDRIAGAAGITTVQHRAITNSCHSHIHCHLLLSFTKPLSTARLYRSQAHFPSFSRMNLWAM